MFTLVVAPFLFIYCLLAIYFVRRAFSKTNKWRFRIMSVAFVLLLPTWDVVASTSLLYIAKWQWANYSLFKTINTDGMCFEGSKCGTVYIRTSKESNREDSIVKPGCAYDNIGNRLFIYTEEIISRQRIDGEYVPFQGLKYYRCTKNNETLSRGNVFSDNKSCFEVDSLNSRYAMKFISYRFLLFYANEMQIYDRASFDVISSAKTVHLGQYAHIFMVPFFNWLAWGDLLFPKSVYIYSYPDIDSRLIIKNSIISKDMEEYNAAKQWD